MLPGAHWWALREKFKQSIPGVVTDGYLAATLNMQPKSARANVLPYLEDIGLIDNDGKTQELAKAWRDDHKYADVCKQMRELIYPDDLLAAAPNPAQDRKPAERWFANNTGAGTSAVRRMGQFYAILVEADVAKKKPDSASDVKMVKTKEVRSKKEHKTDTRQGESPGQTTAHNAANIHPGDQSSPSTPPGISINLQIHISADATPDQIDKIFESMAKHIYKK